jgi:hypothetical protein
MPGKELTPDHNHSGGQPEREQLGPIRPPRDGPQRGPTLTIAEAARLSGVSASTIRRYLAAGRFPTAHQQPTLSPGQRGRWRIPTEDLLVAGLRSHQARTPDHDRRHESPGPQAADHDAHDRVRELQHALEVERTRRQAAETLAAERARTIETLERAVQALQAHHAAAAPNQDHATPLSGPPSAATHTPRPVPQPGMLPMVPRPRLAKRELSQAEKAAMIGRALNKQRPQRRRWP